MYIYIYIYVIDCNCMYGRCGKVLTRNVQFTQVDQKPANIGVNFSIMEAAVLYHGSSSSFP